jgi:hypothetical protein
MRLSISTASAGDLRKKRQKPKGMYGCDRDVFRSSVTGLWL